MASKFGGFLGGGSEPGVPSVAETGREIAPGAATRPPAPATFRGARLPRVGPAPTFAIALDATGSMARDIEAARDRIAEILARVRAQLGRPIQVQFLCYRDYDVFEHGKPEALLETSPMTEDAPTLSSWLAKIKAGYGGDNYGEAIETALEAAYKLTTAPGSRLAAVLLAGDEPSNRRIDLDAHRRQQTPTARDWASRLGERKVPVHTFVIRDRSETISDFEEIARLSGGKTGRLDGSTSMLDMAALAMVAAVGGASAVLEYTAQHRLSGPEKAFATLFLEGPKR